jgi:heptosyltransferase III
MPGEPSRILVYRIGNLGDTVVALPAIQAVRRRFPQARMTLLTERNPNSRLVVASDVLPDGLFDDCVTYNSSDGRTDPRNLLALLPRLRRLRCDLLIYLAPRRRSGWSVDRDLLFFKLAGIRRIIGYRGRVALGPRHPREPLRALEHEADYLLDLVAQGGIPVPQLSERRIDLGLGAAELSFAQNYLRSRAVPLEGFPMAFSPGSKGESKRWPEDHFAQIGVRLVKAYDIFPIVFGGPEEAGLGDRLVAAWGRGVNTAGQLSIRQSAAALSFCRLFVGNDSGPTHLAAAVGVPCVGIYAAIDFPGRWHPYGRQHVVIRHDLECTGCMLARCTTREMRCINSVTVEEVMDACDRLIAIIETSAPCPRRP